MESKKALVSFFNHARENYNKAALGLIRSCVNVQWDGDYLLRSSDGYIDEYLGVKIINGSYPDTEKYGVCQNHNEIPYGFKPTLILEAYEKGYRQIVWADSSIRMVKDISPLLDVAKERGVVAFDNLGYPLKNWLTDLAQERLGITDAELENVPQIMACCIIFDLSNQVGVSVFNDWLTASRDGVSFQNGYGSRRPGFRESRHDQACLSGILWKHQIELLPYGKLVYPPHDKDLTYGDDIYFVNRGMD